ncbi:MAG: molecular chaperone HtpG [Acholeplasmatales bacterium]|nr:molecular chaperone HtpG [Acholeplasmatales bacterium]
MKETKEFKTETKRLLDMMINSIYTHKEIFLRELISNASDAIDKRHYLSLTNTNIPTEEYEIKVEANKAERTITITDNGVGMTKEELEEHLGTIAKSGSKEFLEKISKENQPDVDIIGQFGVGFYSAFMVAKKVTVLTKSVNSDKAYLFESEGLDSYSVEETEKDSFGSVITLYLRDNTEDNDYDKFMEEYEIKDLVKKYSDYVRYPIKTWVTKYDPKDEKDDSKEPKTHQELETINSMLPIWKKNKSEVTDEELNNFYKTKFMDYQDPITSIHVNVEGNITYNALLFIPKKPFYDFYSDRDEKGLQLYTKGVFILDKCKDLIPDYLRFVKGLVDSADLPLNISREMLQEDRALKKIASNVEKKVLSELSSMLKNDRDKYLEFYKDYGLNLKYGLYENYGEKKDKLKDLILLRSFNDDKLISFAEYKEKMPEDQKAIYYAVAKDKAAAEKLPQMEMVKSKGYDVLILSDDVDEFMINVLKEYDGKQFKSINKDDLELLNEEESKKIDEMKEEKKDLLESIKTAIPSAKDVILSKRLVDAPCCVSSTGEITFEMERVLKSQNKDVKADRVFEINPNHAVFSKIEDAYKDNKEAGDKLVNILYNEALIQEGILPDDPKAFLNAITDLILK